ncbi:hypothetical protein [Chakrabartyella piscis]|uniref:hypothetical protein n=1 Tax=Chakrabartyella piscis TaxID=2918914 RepID=UPI0029587B0E|nr:hypothetical protein [Chakrabartyella piscis]
MNGMFLLSTTSTGSNLNGILTIVALLAFIGLVMGLNIRFLKKLNVLAPYLMSDPDTYIHEMELILKKFVPKGYRSMLRINVAIAHMQKRDYTSALSVIKTISPGRMQKNSVGIYYVVLANIYIHLNETQNAMTLIQSSSKKLQKLPVSGNLPMFNSIVAIFYAMETGNWTQAKELLDYAIANWTEPMPGVNFEPLQQRMDAYLAEHPLEEPTEEA